MGTGTGHGKEQKRFTIHSDLAPDLTKAEKG
jgi:hypothetical protein